jgi:hypothetical protein
MIFRSPPPFALQVVSYRILFEALALMPLRADTSLMNH